MPPLLGPRAIDDLRDALAGYTVDGLHELVGRPGQLALARGELTALARCLDDSPLADLVRLFLLGEQLSEARAGRALHPLSLDDAAAGGLVARSSGQVAAAFDLRPYAEADGPSWWVLSDFGSDVRPGPVDAAHVLGIGAASLSLAQATVRTPVARALDIGTGCGVQSLHLSRHCAEVVATDVSARALQLAATTAALNGLEWDLREGSLLDPVGDEPFDLIVANPPFVISSGSVSHDYRDGGLPGDELCRRLVSAIPSRLRPGGTAQLLANWAIGDGQPWDERVASWLEGSGCSAWVWQREVVEPGEYVNLWLRDSGEEPSSAAWAGRYDRWLDWLTGAGIAAIGMGLINIRAVDGLVVCEDVPQLVDQPSGAAIDAWFTRNSWLAACGDDELRSATLSVCPDLVLTSESVVSPDGWHVVDRQLRQTSGLRWEVETDEAVTGLLAALAGGVTLDTAIRLLATAHGLGIEECTAAVLPVVRDLVARGVVLRA